MNQIFSFKRWWLLMRRHWIENSKFFLFGSLSLLGVIAISFMFLLVNGTHYQAYSECILYLIGLFLVGAIFASGAFDALQKKERGIAYLSLPASHFEKLLTHIFYNLIFFTIIYSLCFYAMSEIFELIVKSRVQAEPYKYSFEPLDWEHPREFMVAKNYLITIFFGVQALFLAGSIYFKRFSFILTTIVLVLFILFLGYYINSIQHGLLRGYYGTGASLHSLGLSLPAKIYRLPPALVFILKWLLLLGWAPLFWLVAWFRLREKEI
ncbi:hypothetical protein FSB73_19905 [Arachidicoccus ginsenosidivorans]|uniref:Uncharacterized protein n=1 Tax=Arachidicoccus ginsenosidivorans TaxID=496057 RepID=A0A5B8VR73_9BACT|nr:hypothetical protein [Arachidicoccus ginsenosidivorans]QEC73591.1 hypothetical protein FSB73_19905 [Arachidicoccus ginsenosidivorans]